MPACSNHPSGRTWTPVGMLERSVVICQTAMPEPSIPIRLTASFSGTSLTVVLQRGMECSVLFTSCEDHGSSRGCLKYRRKKCERKRRAAVNHHLIFLLAPESLVDCLDFWPAPRTYTPMNTTTFDMYSLFYSLRREEETVQPCRPRQL
jgi:hypothetical protein